MQSTQTAAELEEKLLTNYRQQSAPLPSGSGDGQFQAYDRPTAKPTHQIVLMVHCLEIDKLVLLDFKPKVPIAGGDFHDAEFGVVGAPATSIIWL